MKRDGIGYDQVMERLQNQIDEEIKIKLCDEVVINDEQKNAHTPGTGTS